MMLAFQIPPSKRIGELKKALEEAVKDGELLGQQPSEYYIDYLLRNRERFEL